MARRAGHGAGSIGKRKDGRWEVRVSLEPGRRKSFYATTYKEAQSRLRRALVDLEQGRLSASPRQTLAEYLTDWLANSRHGLGSPRTYESYRTCVARTVPRIGPLRLDALRPAHVQQLYTDLLDSGLAPRTVEQTHAVLHRALAQAVKLDLCTRNATEAVTVPRPKHREMQTLTATQLDRLFESSVEEPRDSESPKFSPGWHALWVLLGTTGLRKGEALGLMWTDIDFDNRRLVVRRSLQRVGGAKLQFTDPKSDASRRTVQLTEMACSALGNHRSSWSGVSVLAPSGRKRAWYSAQLLAPSSIRPRSMSNSTRHWHEPSYLGFASTICATHARPSFCSRTFTGVSSKSYWGTRRLP